MRGNRRLNHAIHMAAVTQIARKHSPGRACYQRKIAEGKTPAEARRALKRKISNAIYARLLADASRAAGAGTAGPGEDPGNDSASGAAGSHPARQLFGPATPEPGHHPTPAPAPRTRPPARASLRRGTREESAERARHPRRRPDRPPAEPEMARYDIRP